MHPEDSKSGHIESSQSNNLSEGSPGSESFFKRLFRDRDRSLEDSEIFGSKIAKEARIWSHIIFQLDSSSVHVIVVYYASFYMLFYLLWFLFASVLILLSVVICVAETPW